MDLQLRSLTYVKKEWANVLGIFEKVEIAGGQQSQSEWRSFQKNVSVTSRRERDSVDTRFVMVKIFGVQKRGFQFVIGVEGYFDRVFLKGQIGITPLPPQRNSGLCIRTTPPTTKPRHFYMPRNHGKADF